MSEGTSTDTHITKEITKEINKVISITTTFVDKYKSQTLIMTLGVIILLLVVLFGWIFDRLGLKEKSCTKLNIYYPNLTNQSYFNNSNIIKSSGEGIFDNSNSLLINYHVKSAYNCCCGDGYKNNFVALCALEKAIANGCRFLDFEIYSYNNDPIVASSTANSNYIKETYNALLLNEVLTTITQCAFDGVKTTCANDPLILNFRVMSTNLTMLEKMGDLFEEYLDKSINSNFSLLKNSKDAAILSIKMRDLYRTIIIICDFNPQPNIIINPKLVKLKDYINLKGKSLYCNTYRYNEIVAKNGNSQFIQDTKRKFTIVLPNLDNSIKNFDSVNSFVNGCHAICMKHQNLDSNLIGYNNQFEVAGRFSWILKETILLNIVPDPLIASVGNSMTTYSAEEITRRMTEGLGGQQQQQPTPPEEDVQPYQKPTPPQEDVQPYQKPTPPEKDVQPYQKPIIEVEAPRPWQENSSQQSQPEELQQGVNNIDSRGNFTDSQNSRGNLTDSQNSRGNFTDSQNSRGNLTDSQNSRGNFTDSQNSRGNLTDSQNSRGNLTGNSIDTQNLSGPPK